MPDGTVADELHGFLRHASRLRADQATLEFLTRSSGATE
jgi:hypothetical protein